MNTTEINGFEIDVFNQYDLKMGASQSACPLCSHDRKKKKDKCASLNWDRGLGNCHHCSETFQLHTFKRTTDKEWVKPEWKNNTDLSDAAIQWFEARGISQSTLKKMKVSEGPEWMPQTKKEENTIQFNYFINGELINTKFRDGKKNFKLVKGAEKVFYNLDSTLGSDTVVIVEGEIDVLSLVDVGITSVVSVPNGATTSGNNLSYLDNCIDYFNDKSRIIIATDADEAGESLRTELIRRFGAEICYTVDFGKYKDANELLMGDGRNQLLGCIDQAIPVPLENVVQLKDIEHELIDFIENGFKPGFQIGIPSFDSIFSTYTKQFITVTGIPGSGKSDWVDQMAVGYNLKYGWKTAFASPENKPTYIHVHKLVRKYWQGMPDKESVGGDKWKEITKRVNDNFYFLENERYDLDAVLRKGAELVKRKGIRCLVIDPVNKIPLKSVDRSNVNEYTMEYLQKIEMFAKKYDVLVIVVAHPNKMYGDKNGKIEEPNMYSIKGGGEWYDASYHGLLVHRDYQRKTVKVKVMKCKFQNLGTNGAETHFTWDEESGLYDETTDIDVDMPW